MAKENLNCKNQKSNSKDYNDNFDRIFGHIHYKNAYAKILVKKEDLSQDEKDHFYPEEAEEKRIHEIFQRYIDIGILNLLIFTPEVVKDMTLDDKMWVLKKASGYKGGRGGRGCLKKNTKS